MGMNKDFPISKLSEASRLQLRFEFFNVFNHTQFNNAATTVNVVNFGLVNSARDPRILADRGKALLVRRFGC